MTATKTLEDKLDLYWQHVLKVIIERMCHLPIYTSILYVGHNFNGTNVVSDTNSLYTCNFCIKFGVDGKNYVPQLLDNCIDTFTYYNAHMMPFMPFSSLPLSNLESIHDDIFNTPLVVMKNRFGRSDIAIKPTGIIDALHKVGLVPEKIMINLDLKACLA